MFIARNVEEQERKMEKLNSVPSATAKVSLCRKSKLVLECKCRCTSNVIDAKGEDRLTQLTVLTVKEGRLFKTLNSWI